MSKETRPVEIEWRWIERTFEFNFPPEKFPDLLERLRGTPLRLEALIAGVPPEDLTRPLDSGWTIQQNVGHLVDLGYLPRTRLRQILSGERALVAADMTNQKTVSAGHNDRKIEDLLEEFREERGALVAEFERLAPEDWSRSGIHPRLQQPMRIVDIVYFDSEHDDYHLARISRLKRMLEKARR